MGNPKSCPYRPPLYCKSPKVFKANNMTPDLGVDPGEIAKARLLRRAFTLNSIIAGRGNYYATRMLLIFRQLGGF
jgi:hypothetical protein